MGLMLRLSQDALFFSSFLINGATECSIFIYLLLSQGLAIFVDPLESPGTDESAPNDSILSVCHTPPRQE